MTDHREVSIGPLPADDIQELVEHLTETGIRSEAISVTDAEEGDR